MQNKGKEKRLAPEILKTDYLAEATARHSRNQKNKFFLEQKQSQKSPLPPFIKGGLGGI